MKRKDVPLEALPNFTAVVALFNYDIRRRKGTNIEEEYEERLNCIYRDPFYSSPAGKVRKKDKDLLIVSISNASLLRYNSVVPSRVGIEVLYLYICFGATKPKYAQRQVPFVSYQGPPPYWSGQTLEDGS